MADNETDKTPNPYEDALWKAYNELNDIKKQEHELTVRKLRLNQTVNALFPIVYPLDQTADINSYSLANAIRLVIKSTDRGISAKEVRGKLQDLGFDFSKYSNPLASIWTASKRMIEAEELVLNDDEDEKKLIAGPELKPVPETEDRVAALDQIAEQHQP